LQEGAGGFLETLSLMRSDLLFNAGYAILWVGLFAVVRRGVLRKIVVVHFHAVSLLVVAITTTAYQYFEATGSTLDWSVIVFYLGTLGEVKSIIASEAPWYAWVVLVVALLYVVVGPWFVARITAPRRGRQAERTADVSRLGAMGLGLISVGLVSLSLVPGTADANQSFSLSPFVNVLVTGIGGPEAEELEVEEVSSRAASSLREVRLEKTPQTDRQNVVLIHLESVRERSITPYNENMDTTPFLNELAKESLLVERAYTTIPHTSKALTAVNCGIYPSTETDIIEAQPNGVPVRCLPRLLGEKGYAAAYFQSATALSASTES
jgi:lipoteichoic acid synthase